MSSTPNTALGTPRLPDSMVEGKRKFPDIAQYQAAVRGKHFLDPEALQCQPKLSKLKRPLHYSGAFAVAFPLLDAEGSTKYAVRFWTQRVPGDTKDRYRVLKVYLREHPELAAHFASFEYLEEGVNVMMQGKMELFPMLRMEWIPGQTPKDYLVECMELEPVERRRRMEQCLQAWRTMLATLQKHRTAHGDLWNDNIRFVRHEEDGQLSCVLIDYDSIYVPDLVHPPKVTGSIGGYRNPFDATTEQIDSTKVESSDADDYFSGFAILIALEGLVEDPGLWDEFGGKAQGENEFLFREADFLDPDNSALFARLNNAESTTLQRNSRLLMDICRSKLPSHQLLSLNQLVRWDARMRLELSPSPRHGADIPIVQPLATIPPPPPAEPEAPALAPVAAKKRQPTEQFQGPAVAPYSNNNAAAHRGAYGAAAAGSPGMGIPAPPPLPDKFVQPPAPQLLAPDPVPYIPPVPAPATAVTPAYVQSDPALVPPYHQPAYQAPIQHQKPVGGGTLKYVLIGAALFMFVVVGGSGAYFYYFVYLPHVQQLQEEQRLADEKADKEAEKERLARQAAEEAKKKKEIEQNTRTDVTAWYNEAERYYHGKGATQDYVKALPLFTKAANQGHASSQNYLGTMYLKGFGVQKNEATAAEWYKKSAAQGYDIAQYNMGLIYNKGMGVEKNLSLSHEWYEKSAAQGYADAQNVVGYNFQHGRGVLTDYSKAVTWYKKAADQGNVLAQYNLGYCYSEGVGVTRDYVKAREFYEKAAKQGDADAMNSIGAMYELGNGVYKDTSTAREWYEKAAKEGHALAQKNLGLLLENGYGGDRDYAKARYWYEKSADQGNLTAMYSLAYLWRSGLGGNKDLGKAIALYQKAADQGHAPSQNNLGYAYQYGSGVTLDYTKAFELYQKSANQGDMSGMTNLGCLYQYGIGTKQDYAKAVEWYEKSAAKGHASATNNLGFMYQKGYGVKLDYDKAVEWYRKAADMGDASGCTNLGFCYANGMGLTKDYTKALEWYNKGAGKGDSTACYFLGAMYQNGTGVTRNLATAREWYQKAADRGSSEAKKELTKMGY